LLDVYLSLSVCVHAFFYYLRVGKVYGPQLCDANEWMNAEPVEERARSCRCRRRRQHARQRQRTALSRPLRSTTQSLHQFSLT